MRGDIVEIFPAYEDDRRCASSFSGTTIETICEIDPMRGEVLRRIDKATIYPASHYVTGQERMQAGGAGIREELNERLKELHDQGKLLEAQRLAAAHAVTISRCWRRWAFARASRTTRAT